jgi:uncharacterized protein YegL
MKIWNPRSLISKSANNDTDKTQALSLAEAVEFAENPEPRCPCILLLDTSGSMQGEAIKSLNEGLQTFKQELNQDNLAKKRVEVAIVTFNSEVEVAQDFMTADEFEPPTLTAQGLTQMGTAILQGLDMLDIRKAMYRANGVTYYRPWIFLITDGEPQGESDSVVEQAAQRIKDDEANKRVAFFAVGVEEANMTRLEQIVVRNPLKLKGLNFKELFIWLSASMQRVSQSQLDEQTPLPPANWAVE